MSVYQRMIDQSVTSLDTIEYAISFAKSSSFNTTYLGILLLNKSVTLIEQNRNQEAYSSIVECISVLKS